MGTQREATGPCPGMFLLGSGTARCAAGAEALERAVLC